MNDEALLHPTAVRLQHAYADLATRKAWPELAALTTPEAKFSFDLRSGAPLEMVGPAAVGEFGARAVAPFSHYQYIPLNTVVMPVDEGRARGRAYALELAEIRDSGDWLEVYGLYHDDYALVDDGWRFSQRRFQVLARRTGGRLKAFAIED
jgi:hypothetical protein